MTFREYQENARRTQNKNLTPRERLEHALWGMSAEVGEVCSIHQKTYQGHDLDAVALRKEIGDVMWFVAEMCDVYDWDMGWIAEDNIAKLRRRYPEGFSVDRSLHREVNGDA